MKKRTRASTDPSSENTTATTTKTGTQKKKKSVRRQRKKSTSALFSRGTKRGRRHRVRRWRKIEKERPWWPSSCGSGPIAHPYSTALKDRHNNTRTTPFSATKPARPIKKPATDRMFFFIKDPVLREGCVLWNGSIPRSGEVQDPGFLPACVRSSLLIFLAPPLFSFFRSFFPVIIFLFAVATEQAQQQHINQDVPQLMTVLYNFFSSTSLSTSPSLGMIPIIWASSQIIICPIFLKKGCALCSSTGLVS